MTVPRCRWDEERGEHQKNAQADRERFTASDLHDAQAYGLVDALTATPVVWHSPRVSAQPAVAPAGVVTFLFTDVEGLIRRWEDDASAMRSALAEHDEVLRRAISAHGGYLFKHTGDGVCAAFASPKSAVDAAIAAQRQPELPVRMGIATGEAELRDSDYFGTVLNRAGRAMAAGHGGQVLVADSTVRLLTGVELADLGQHRLRDLPEPIGVFQVGHPTCARSSRRCVR